MTPMQGDSSGVVATTTTTASTTGGGGGVVGDGAISEFGGSSNNNSAEEEDKGIRSGGVGDDGDRSLGGNRWPRQETLALLKIRADMDAAFRDASVKGPLWDEVSRKLAGLGYNRSAKKCREKFENVSKYHKRTKEGRSGKQLGKAYRFFDQLEALEGHSSSQPKPPQPPQVPLLTTTMAVPVALPLPPPPPPAATSVDASYIITVPSSTAVVSPPNVPSQGIATTAINLAIPSFPSPSSNPNIQSSFLNFPTPLLSDSTSSSTSSDVEIQGRRRGKRKWKDLFETLMNEVMNRQEEMQKKFLEVIEKREHDRKIREEAWRAQEMARISREREILAQERSIADAKDAAVMAFLQKLSIPRQQQVQNNSQPQLVQRPTPPPSGMPQPQPQPQITPISQPPSAANNLETKSDDGDQSLMPASSSRWPKVETEALINLRTNIDWKYEDNGPKGPLWEEISAGMRKLGYNRNAKRCKEKWENINKYFKKMKESNKRWSQDSKTCPYFYQLDALYNEKHKIDGSSNSSSSNVQIMKPDQINSVPLMVQPEQQWPPLPPRQQGTHESVMEDLESEDDQNHQNYDDDDKNMDDLTKPVDMKLHLIGQHR